MKVFSDWPGVADVTVNLEDLPVFIPDKGWVKIPGIELDLTEEQAREFAEKLVNAYQEARKRKQEFDDYCKAHNIKEGD